MKIRNLMFVFVIGCGGDRPSQVSVSTSEPPVHSILPSLRDFVPVTTPVVENPVVQPVEPVTVVEAHMLPTKFEEALAMGRDLESQGKHADAKEMFDVAVKLDRKKAEPHVELARVHIALGEKGLAIKEANLGVKLAPDSSQAWNTKGRAELLRFSYDDAIAAFSKAVELNQDNVWAWNNLGYTELQLKKYDDAVEHLTEATTRKGATGYMFNNLGTALEQLDRLDEARLAFDAGGKLGSKEAASSRKRLEGVDSIAIFKDSKPATDAAYDNNEGQTDEDQGTDVTPVAPDEAQGSDNSTM